MKLYLLFGLLLAVVMATVMAAPAPTEEAVAEPVADLEGQEHLLRYLLWKHHVKKAYKYGYPLPPPYGYSPYYYWK